MKDQINTIREALNLIDHNEWEQRDAALTALSELERMAGEPVAWKHNCAALLANDVELRVDNCPHCGRPRAAPPAQPQYEAADMASAAAQGFRDGQAAAQPLTAGKMPPTTEECRAAAFELGGWLSAALDDPTVCAEYKQAINAWFNCAMPYPPAQQAQCPDFHDEWTGFLKDGETPFERFLRERKDLTSLTKPYQRALEENERLKAQQAEAVPPDVEVVRKAIDRATHKEQT